MIGSLTSSPSSSTKKIVLEDFSRGVFRSGAEIFCLVPRKTFNVEFLRFDSSRTITLKPLRSSIPSEASQVDFSAAEIQTQEKYLTKTVHVRFQLQKECAFGEHFFILGDDPAFGLWDPENAIPLNWSDGHVWTVELDLPVGKSIEFKFILKGKTGQIWWQPGQNRVLQTWETSNSITICEDWENTDLQRIFEDELAPVDQEGLESSVDNSEKEAEALSSSIMENPAAIVAENVGYNQDDSASSFISDAQNEGKEGYTNDSLTSLDKHGTEEALVPGMTLVSTFEKEDKNDGGDKEASATYAPVEVINEGVTENSPELETEGKRKREGEGREFAEVNGVEQRHRKAEGEEERVMEKDIQWGQRTLQKLLNSLGLLQHFQ